MRKTDKCPKCGGINGYLSKGVFTQFYDVNGKPDGYVFDGKETKTVQCIDCGFRIKRDRIENQEENK